MKLKRYHTVNYFEVDALNKIRLSSLLRHLQEAAFEHTKIAGFVAGNAGGEFAWVLNRLMIDVDRYPVYGETISIITWHRGSNGFRSYREYEVFSGDKKIASASSLWLYINLMNRKIMKIPAEVDEKYRVIDEKALEVDLDSVKSNIRFDTAFSTDITIRNSDFDANSHVNNTVYFDFVETLVKAHDDKPFDIRSLSLCYSAEIDKSIKMIRASLGPDGDSTPFNIFDEGKVFAAGMLVKRC